MSQSAREALDAGNEAGARHFRGTEIRDDDHCDRADDLSMLRSRSPGELPPFTGSQATHARFEGLASKDSGCDLISVLRG